MSPSIYTCLESTTVRECAKLMRDHNIGFVPVVDAQQRLVGVVTDRDLALRVIAEGKNNRTTVGAVMSRDLVACHPEDDVSEVERSMASAQKSRMVVVDGDKAVGVISLSTLAHADDPARAAEVLRAVTEREAPHTV